MNQMASAIWGSNLNFCLQLWISTTSFVHMFLHHEVKWLSTYGTVDIRCKLWFVLRWVVDKVTLELWYHCWRCLASHDYLALEYHDTVPSRPKVHVPRPPSPRAWTSHGGCPPLLGQIELLSKKCKGAKYSVHWSGQPLPFHRQQSLEEGGGSLRYNGQLCFLLKTAQNMHSGLLPASQKFRLSPLQPLYWTFSLVRHKSRTLFVCILFELQVVSVQ